MMTTISAGAAAGLLVALMVVATSDSRAAEPVSPPLTGANDIDRAPSVKPTHPLHLARAAAR